MNTVNSTKMIKTFDIKKYIPYALLFVVIVIIIVGYLLSSKFIGYWNERNKMKKIVSSGFDPKISSVYADDNVKKNINDKQFLYYQFETIPLDMEYMKKYVNNFTSNTFGNIAYIHLYSSDFSSIAGNVYELMIKAYRAKHNV